MTFFVVVLNTQAKSAKLTTLTLQLTPAQHKFPTKIGLLALPAGVHFCLRVNLQLNPINYAPPIFFSALGVHPWLRLCVELKLF